MTADDAQVLAGCTVQRLARGGPGGQHANKTASAVRLVHRATGLVVEAADERDGTRNRAIAVRRLRLALACAVRGGADPAWLAPHVRGGHLHCGPHAGSWPQVVAVLLDALAVARGSLRDAAVACGLSSSQLAKALVADQEVRRAADAIRQAAGLGVLKA